MNEASKNALALVARLSISLIFVLSGFSKITGWSDTAAYMVSKGMTAVPLFLALAIFIELGAGMMVMLGYRARLGALALIIFVIPTTIIFHNFWALQASEQQLQMIMFLKNLSILGGLLMIVAYGAGKFSLDGRRASVTTEPPDAPQP